MKNPWVVIGVIALVLFGGSFWYASESAERNNEGVEVRPHIKGNSEAEVVLVKYSDFSCPACAQAAVVVQDIMSEWGDAMAFEYRHFPFISPASTRAAVATEAAGQQGKFYEYHDLLFANQTAWLNSPNPAVLFLEYAEQLGLDLDTFRRHINSSLLREHVMADMAAGRNLGVTGTPTFFLNGQRLSFQTYDEFRDQIVAAITGSTATSTPETADTPAIQFGI